MDELKKYLQQHAEKLDLDEPGDVVWSKIKKGSDNAPAKPKLINMFGHVAAAAAVVAILFIAIKTFNRDKSGTMIAEATVAEVNTWEPLEDTIPVKGVETKEEKKLVADIISKPTIKKKSLKDKQYDLMNSFKENYSQLVNYQLSNIRNTPVYAESPDYFEDFKIRLKQMDADELIIRKNIKATGINNVLLEQLINIYQQKLDVLKSLQKEINKMNSKIKLSPETTDTLNKFYLNI